MTFDRSHPDSPGHAPRGSSESLPAEFTASDRRIDDALASAAQRSRTPAGLAERVFYASVAQMPSFETAPAPRRLVFPAAIVLRQTAWARFALAACVLLVTGVAVWMMQSPPTSDSSSLVPGTLAKGEKLRVADELALDEFATLPQGSSSEIESDMAYLIDTNDVTSFDPLTIEMSSLVASLETM